MKVLVAAFFLSTSAFAQSWNITQVAPIPEPVSNNAVCEGFTPAGNYIYSFGGIDTTKSHSGIHLRSYRMNVETVVWETIAELPDTMGKIASAASRIGDIIYIIGGYHVFPDGHEVSSHKVHRYSISQNQYLEDGANIPIPIDDQVQAVWRDSLIYVITGWSNNGNVLDVQIYDAHNDNWQAGTTVPTTQNYNVFGASGTIVGDTIYYFGGAGNSFNFPSQRFIRKGVINASDPSQIEWSTDFFDPDVKGYRMACTTSPLGHIHWLGGSDVTYNFNGIAYNGSGGVPTTGRNLYFQHETGFWAKEDGLNLPMDLRGVCEISDSVKYIIGGMVDPQQVTDQVIRLEWNDTGWNSVREEQRDVRVYPNPASDLLIISSETSVQQWELHDLNGRLLKFGTGNQIDISDLPNGLMLLSVHVDSDIVVKKVSKQ